MLDNQGDYANGSRVLQLSLDGPPATSATIVKSWVLSDASGAVPIQCAGQGSGELVPGTSDHVIAMCNPERTVEELSDTTGSVSTPLLHLSLPAAGYCTSGGPASRTDIRGWYRAFPVTAIGEF